MKRFLFYLLAITLVACTKSEDGGNSNLDSIPEKTKNEIKLETSSSNFSSGGGNNTISFTSTEAWTAEVINSRADGWCTINPTSGAAGLATITVTTQPNDTPDDRSATVKIKAGSSQKTINITQKQKDALTVTASKFEVKAEGGEINIEIKANIDFDYVIEESGKDWVKYEGTRALKASTLTFSVSKNDDTEKRECKIYIQSGEFNEVVTIYQTGSEPTIVISKNEYVVSSNSETIAVEVTSNVDVAVEIPADIDWISENTTRATSTNTYYFNIQPNEDYDQRSAKIKFTNKENGLSETITIVQTQKDALVVAKDSYAVNSEGDQIEIEVGHNIDFDIEIANDWITKVDTRAFVTETIVFNIAKHTGHDNREGTIIFKSKDGKLSQTVKVYQAQEDALIISKKDIVVSDEGGTISFELHTNVDFKVSDPDVDWLRAVTTRGLTTHTLHYEVDANSSYNSREAKIVVTDTKNNKSETITIVQTQKDAIVLAEAEYEFGVDGGNLDFEVQTNVDITVTISNNAKAWIQQIGTRTLETKTLYFNVSPCSSEEDREGSITISGGSATQTIIVKQSGLKEILEKEREALIAFYNATSGNNWKNNSNWCSDKPLNEWYGVLTSRGQVVHLGLNNNNLNGYIPEDIAKLSKLELIQFGNNLLYGEIPYSIGNLQSLKFLELEQNRLSGSIPNSICKLTNLLSLGLNDNRLSGQIPADIGNLQSLEFLKLERNQLSGSIPNSICKLTNLRWLRLNDNRLSGQIPADIGNLELLETLKLSNYSIGPEGGEFDAFGPVPEVERINHISGEIPKSIGNLKKLRTFEMIGNKLTGEIPDELWLIPTLECVLLSGNYLAGELSPAIGNARNLRQLWLKNNCFTGSLPDEICELSNLEELLIGNAGMSVVGKFDKDTQYNKFEGELPQNISKLSNLRQLDLMSCRFSGAIPDGLWNIPTLRVADLRCNFFSGELSPAIGNAKNIYGLDLSNNNLSGIIPDEICDMTNLYNLSIGNYNIVDDINIDPVTQFNSFEGDIPQDIHKLSELTWFAAINNNITGPFPEYFAFNPKMKGCPPSLSRNRMSGIISKDILNSENWKSWAVAVESWILKQQDGYGFDLEYDMYESTDYSKDGEVKQLQAATKGDGIYVVLMGDAYSDRLIANGTYDNVMNVAMEKFFMEEPYKSFRDHFNVYSVKAVSKNEIYNPVSSTAFDGYFGGETLVGGNDARVLSYAEKAIGTERMDDALIVVMMNSSEYAGTCYMYSPSDSDWGNGVSISYFPVGEDDTALAQVIHHEAAGHGFSKLGDEYAYEYMGEIPAMEIESAKQLGAYGWWKNVDFTNDPSKVKWSHFLSDARYANDGLGVYEGAFTYWTDVWRSTESSIMRYNTGGFNAPSREAIYYRIHKLAYGADWEYDYEKFVEWDARNRSTAAVTRGVPYRLDIPEDFKPLHAPVVMNTSWRNAKNNTPAKKTVAPSGNAGRNSKKVSSSSVSASKSMTTITTVALPDGTTRTITREASGATITTYSK